MIWGPRDQSLVPRLLALAAAGRLRRVGDGTNLIDTAYVENVAEAHLLAADALSPGSRVAGRAYFISQGEPVNCWQWIDSLLALAGLAPIRKRMSLGRPGQLARRWSFSTACSARNRTADDAIPRRPVGAQPLLPTFRAAREDFGYQPAGLDRRGIAAIGGELAAMPANRGDSTSAGIAHPTCQKLDKRIGLLV